MAFSNPQAVRDEQTLHDASEARIDLAMNYNVDTHGLRTPEQLLAAQDLASPDKCDVVAIQNLANLGVPVDKISSIQASCDAARAACKGLAQPEVEQNSVTSSVTTAAELYSSSGSLTGAKDAPGAHDVPPRQIDVAYEKPREVEGKNASMSV